MEMRIPEEFDDEIGLRMARKQVNVIVSSLPERVDAAAFTLNSKLPFKALSLREVLIHRISELAECAMDQYEQRKLVPAFVLTRAAIETVSLIYWLHKKLSEFIESKDIDQLDGFLMKTILGSKDNTTTIESYNVLTAIDHVDKKFENFRKMYDGLCEFTHPNWSGALGAYGKIDRENIWLDLGPDVKSPPLALGLVPFLRGLAIFVEYYNDLERLIRNLNTYFEESGADSTEPVI